MTAPRTITVVGAGVIGLWQALTLARAGHRVTLREKSPIPFADAASRHAGAMLAPDCESEAAPEIVRAAGHRGLALWRATYPGLINAGSLVLALPRDQPDLARFERLTQSHESIDANRLATLEPDLAGRFPRALFFPREAHMPAAAALQFLAEAAATAGVKFDCGTAWQPGEDRTDLVVDCRGHAAKDALPGLRNVRGERVLIRTTEIHLSRPVRLLHPRHPIYVVPWGKGLYVVGATVIESDDDGPITVRSALELLGAAYALHPAFGEAEIIETGASLRPAFPDNVPRAIVNESATRISVNGAYRHGFLLAPVLAEAVANYVADQTVHELVIRL